MAKFTLAVAALVALSVAGTRVQAQSEQLASVDQQAIEQPVIEQTVAVPDAQAPAAVDLTVPSGPSLHAAELSPRLATETAQDANVLKEGAGDLANGFISVGGASTPEIASDQMKAFVAAYTKKFGEYNDESNTKVYALQYIVDTLKANPAAIDNVDEFKKTMDTFSAQNPYLKDPSAKLTYVGSTSFGQKRQLSVPMVVNEYENGEFKTMFVGTVD